MNALLPAKHPSAPAKPKAAKAHPPKPRKSRILATVSDPRLCPTCGQTRDLGVLLVHVTLPVVTKSEANQRGHWSKKSGRMAEHRRVAKLVMQARAGKMPSGSLRIVLTRLAPGLIRDSDNLVSSQKGVRDGVSDWLGIDDGDPRLSWEVRGERAKEYAVRVEVYQRETAREGQQGVRT